MYSSGLAVLTEIYSRIDVLFVLMVRFFGFINSLPIFTGRSFPTIAKVGLSLFVGYLVLITQNVEVVYNADNVISYVTMLTREYFVGLVLAFVVYMFFSLVYFSGQIIDFNIGFSMVSVMDPLSQIQVPIVGNMYYWVISLLFIQSGGLNSFLAAFFYSYERVPINSAILVANPGIASICIDLIIKFYSAGIQVAMPIVATILVVDVSLGLLVKAAPQMNIFVVGMPIKLLIGLFVLFYITPLFAEVYSYTFDEAYKSMVHIMQVISP